MEQNKRNFDPALFKKTMTEMVATNDKATSYWGSKWKRAKIYTLEEVKSIIESDDLTKKIQLSNDFFNTDSFYQQVILHYATLPLYTGILVPNSTNGQNFKKDLNKKYYGALNLIEKMKLPSFFSSCTLKILRDGCYYGVVCALDKNNFAVWDLPQDYCRTRYKDFQGNDLVELNLNWFNTITDKEVREATLRIFPKEIRNEFTKYINNKRKDCWMILNPEIGICFPYLENSAPLFLSMIPSSIYYDKTVDTEIEREEEEIKKIIVQKVPHNASTNELVFEPEEALEMHTGTVGMLKGNKNLSVLTTYADVDAIVSKTAGESTSNTLEKMANNVYYKAGVSGQIFGAGSNSSVSLSIINDISKLTPILQKYSVFVTNIINRVFGNQNLSFKYTILPVSLYNQKEYVDSAYKLAGSGYSYLLPAVSMGMSQQELVSIKDLENNILELHDKLIPLSSTYTQGNDDKGGAPLKNQENKADQTIENEKSAENTGGNL